MDERSSEDVETSSSEAMGVGSGSGAFVERSCEDAEGSTEDPGADPAPGKVGSRSVCCETRKASEESCRRTRGTTDCSASRRRETRASPTSTSRNELWPLVGGGPEPEPCRETSRATPAPSPSATPAPSPSPSPGVVNMGCPLQEHIPNFVRQKFITLRTGIRPVSHTNMSCLCVTRDVSLSVDA